MSDVQLIHGDCLEVMPTLPAQSVQMVFADLPYGVSACSWDKNIQLNVFLKAVAFCANAASWHIYTATQPFASHIMQENISNFRHDLIWHRTRVTGFFNAKKAPLRAHEHLLVFGKQAKTYNPIMIAGKPYCKTGKSITSAFYGSSGYRADNTHKGAQRYPRSVLTVAESDLRNDSLNGRTERRIHPTQKPVALLEYLIRTYTNPGDTVLDPVAGSGTTAIAAMRTGRKAICIEKDATYFAAMTKRVADERARMVQAPLAI